MSRRDIGPNDEELLPYLTVILLNQIVRLLCNLMRSPRGILVRSLAENPETQVTRETQIEGEPA